LFHRTKVSARAREGIPFAVRRISALLAVLGLSLVAGCLDTLAGADSDAAAVTKIEITASSGPVIGVGQSVEFSARVRNDGTWRGALPGEVEWRVNPRVIGEITEAGRFTARRPGPAVVWAHLHSEADVFSTYQIQVVAP
jgi:hypothetical protein